MNCQADNLKGQPCGAAALKGDDFCYMHSPSKAEERAQARKLGGYRTRRPHGSARSPRRVRSIGHVLKLLDYALGETLELENSITRGRLLVALAGEYIKALDVGEFEQRLQAIEQKVGL